MKILVTTTLNKNLTEAKMKPLIALNEVEEIFYISDRPGPKLDKVTYYCVPGLVLKIFNNNSIARVFFKFYMVFYLAVFKKPDLLMGYSFTPHGINAAIIGRILNIPSCIHVIGSIPSIEGGGITCGNNIFLKTLKKSCFLENILLGIAKWSKLITVTGSHTKDYLISRGINEKNIEILSSTVDTGRFHPVQAEKEYDVITMSELIPSKRIDVFLEVISRLKKTGLNPKAVILGEGPLELSLRDMAKRLDLEDNVYFAGFHPNVEEYLNKSRIFLMPTDSEGLSLAMLEAMACGTVPVVSNVGDLSDAIEDGVNGRLIAKHDTDGFCSAVHSLLKDAGSYELFSKNAAQTIKRSYSIQNASAKWRNILAVFMKPEKKPSSWLFSRLKAMSFKEMAYRLACLLRTRMLGLSFLFMAKDGYLLAGNSGNPKFFIDDEDMDFIRMRTKERKADIILPSLENIDWHADIGFEQDIKRRAGFSGIELAEIWKLNRFQRFVVYAQKYAIDKDEDAARKTRLIIEDWIRKNPVLRGINWMDSLEISMRLLSWSYIYFLIKDSKVFDKDFENMFLKSIYCQIRFVEVNLSKYSSANNHLAGEAAGLFAVGVLFPQLKGSEKRLKLGKSIMEEEIKKQVYADGVGKEQSTHYHEFITDLYLIAVILGRRNGVNFSADLNAKLEKMCEFIMHMTDNSLKSLHIGDSDDGVGLKLNTFESFSNVVSILNTAGVLFNNSNFKRDKNGFDEKSLWLLGHEGYELYSLLEPARKNNALDSKDFPEGGYYIIRHKGLCLRFDCGEIGYLSLAGHGHADSLSFTLGINDKHIFVDLGTYMYHSDNKWRNYFRGTAGHNTIRVDGLDQSEALGPFLWGYKAKSYLKYWTLDKDFDKVCGYHTGYARLKDPVTHSREIILDKLNREIIITDSVYSKGGHYIEQFFHLHPGCLLKSSGEHLFEITCGDVILTMETDKRLDSCVFNGSESPIAGWYSDKFGEKQKTNTICGRVYSKGSMNFITKISLSDLDKSDGKEK
jgi:glycosyltransferase involved in cell wall biosynthesis